MFILFALVFIVSGPNTGFEFGQRYEYQIFGASQTSKNIAER